MPKQIMNKKTTISFALSVLPPLIEFLLKGTSENLPQGNHCNNTIDLKWRILNHILYESSKYRLKNWLIFYTRPSAWMWPYSFRYGCWCSKIKSKSLPWSILRSLIERSYKIILCLRHYSSTVGFLKCLKTQLMFQSTRTVISGCAKKLLQLLSVRGLLNCYHNELVILYDSIAVRALLT